MNQTSLLTGIVAFVMLAGGVAHLAAPEAFVVIVPRMLPAFPVIIASGLVELAIGMAVLVPRFRPLAGLAFALLCLGYTPLHLWDFFRPDPIFHPWPLALARIAVQAGFVWAGFRLSRTQP